jgi:hypothetical protein
MISYVQEIGVAQGVNVAFTDVAAPRGTALIPVGDFIYVAICVDSNTSISSVVDTHYGNVFNRVGEYNSSDLRAELWASQVTVQVPMNGMDIRITPSVSATLCACAEQYTGGTSFGINVGNNLGSPSNTASGELTIQAANNFVVFASAWRGNFICTGFSTGNGRNSQVVFGKGSKVICGVAIQDNTSSTVGLVSNTASLSGSTEWAGVSAELQS